MNRIPEHTIDALKNLVENDVNTFEWKDKNGEYIKMVDASLEQLNEWEEHCNSMLYSTNAKKPGRVVIYNIVKEQQRACNTETFLRYLKEDPNIGFSKLRFNNIILEFKARNNHIPNLDSYSIDYMLAGIDNQYSDVTIKNAQDGCLDNLGRFYKYFSFQFILRQGLWLSKKDSKLLDIKNNTMKEKIERVKEVMNLKEDTRLFLTPKGLTYKEFKAMCSLRNAKYSDLTTEQLNVLKNKILGRYMVELTNQINEWEVLLTKIKKVKDLKNAQN